MADQGRIKKRKKLVKKVAAEHFNLAGKDYHWDVLPSGKRKAHLGLGWTCPLFIGHMKETL